MQVLKPILRFYLLAVALAMGINWIATPLYHDGSADYPVWAFLNWFMAAALIIVLVVNSLRKYRFARQDKGNKAITRDYLEVNLAFAATIILALWYFWNWTALINPGSESPAVDLIHLEWWAFINPLGVLVYAYTGFHLWSTEADE